MRTVWDIIKSPVITEKALVAKEATADKKQLLTFRVDRHATKPEIKPKKIHPRSDMAHARNSPAKCDLAPPWTSPAGTVSSMLRYNREWRGHLSERRMK